MKEWPATFFYTLQRDVVHLEDHACSHLIIIFIFILTPLILHVQHWKFCYHFHQKTIKQGHSSYNIYSIPKIWHALCSKAIYNFYLQMYIHLLIQIHLACCSSPLKSRLINRWSSSLRPRSWSDANCIFSLSFST